MDVIALHTRSSIERLSFKFSALSTSAARRSSPALLQMPRQLTWPPHCEDVAWTCADGVAVLYKCMLISLLKT
jgi:hypothetical protein